MISFVNEDENECSLRVLLQMEYGVETDEDDNEFGFSTF